MLERFTSKSGFSNHGHRVVAGQRLMQAASDIFLGWERFAWDGDTRDYYFRQLRDWKGSADIRGMTPGGMAAMGADVRWTLARAHARSGDRIAIAAYLGRSDVFDRDRDSPSRTGIRPMGRPGVQDAVAGGRLVAQRSIGG